MPILFFRRSTIVALGGSIAAILTQGCIPAPVALSRSQLTPAPASATHFTDPRSRPDSASTAATTRPALPPLWKVECVPPRIQFATRPVVKRIAITDFEVEFVTVRSRTPFESQLAVKIPPWDPIGGAVELIGIGRAETPIGPEERMSLTNELFDRFNRELTSRGREVLPQSAIHAQPAFAELSAGHVDGESADSSPLDYLRLLSTDIGVINASTRVPADGTRLASDGQSAASRRQSETHLLDATHADLTIAVHLLVGCYRDRAAVEQGSRIRMMGLDQHETTLTSQRSVLSDRKVRTPAHFVPVVGNVEPIKGKEFDEEIEKLMPPYLEPVLAGALGGQR